MARLSFEVGRAPGPTDFCQLPEPVLALLVPEPLELDDDPLLLEEEVAWQGSP